MTSSTLVKKPNVLILGGVGFVGRNLVTYLVERQVCGTIRVVDKVLPATAYFTARQQKAFETVDYLQGNLVNPASIEKCFEADFRWDYVFNLAAETKYSQAEDIYQEKVYLLSLHCAQQAAKSQVGVFVEMSTAQVYDADKKSSGETAKLKPWTLLAKYKLKAEEELSRIPGLRLVIVRPATIYGVGDMSGLTPRLIIAAVYKELREEMKFLWNKDLRINTVHVTDVARALLALAEAAVDQKFPSGSVFNLCDQADTDQEMVNVVLRKIFDIQTGYQGTIISNLARLNLKDVTEEINEKHLQPWSDICKRAGVMNTPLTPYLDQELLYNNSLSVDGSKVEQVLGFRYQVPAITEDRLREVLQAFVEVGIFPRDYVKL